MDQMQRLYAINQAIWIRDNAKRISKELLIERIQDLAEFNLFSNRQLSKICLNVLSYNTIGNYVNKTNRSGGNISAKALEDIRDILFSKERNKLDLVLIKKTIASGTSQGTLAKLTGVSQTLISRSIKNER